MAVPHNYSTSTLKDHVGHDFGETEPVMVDQDRINGFADVTGDHQWIHTDIERSKAESPFGGTIAHGFLTLSMLAASVQDAGVVPKDAAGVVNYGIDKVRFIAPVPSGTRLTARFRLAGVEDKGKGRQLVRIEASATPEGSDKPAVLAELLAMVMV